MAEHKGKGAQNSVSFMRSALAKYVYMLVNVIDQSSRTTHLVDAIYVNLIMHDLIHTNQNSEFHKLWDNKSIGSNFSILAVDILYRHFSLTENEIISFLYIP